MDDFWAAIIVIAFISWSVFTGQLDRDFDLKQKQIESITYRYTQIAAKKGTLYSSVYNEFENKLSLYGDFDIYITAEKYTGNNTIPEIINNHDTTIIGMDLRNEGYDVINVYVENTKRHPLSRLYELSPLGIITGKSYDIRLVSKASVFIQ